MMMSIINRLSKSIILGRFIKFPSTIYGRVVLILTSSLVFLFVLFNLVFRSVYTEYFNRNLQQCGDNMSSIVEGSLYYSMLENDKAMLQRTLDIISTMSGIGQVNMYDVNNNLAYTTSNPDNDGQGNPDCKSCHTDLHVLFPENVKSYHIVGDTADCGVFGLENSSRQLLIRTPILNEPSCYTAECHAHSRDDKLLGSMVIKMPLDSLDRMVNRSSTEFLLIAMGITIFVVSFLIIFTRRRIKHPLNSLIEASDAVSAGNNSFRLDINPALLDDMKKVSLAFNNMLDNLESSTKELQNWSHQLEYKVQKKSEELMEAQNELVHVERIASLGKLSSSVAHEINNPLSGILIYTKLVHKQVNNDDFKHPKKEALLKHLKYIEDETKRCGDIVKGLLDFSRKDQEGFVQEDIHKILSSTCNLITHSAKISGIKVTTDLKAVASEAWCSPNQLKQAFFALMVNASEAINKDGEIRLETFNPDNENIRVSITDNGCGIAPGELAHIFQPFFTTKHDSRGTGLGLAIVHGIIVNHKGKIDVESEPGKGTKMTITLPLKGQK